MARPYFWLRPVSRCDGTTRGDSAAAAWAHAQRRRHLWMEVLGAQLQDRRRASLPARRPQKEQANQEEQANREENPSPTESPREASEARDQESTRTLESLAAAGWTDERAWPMEIRLPPRAVTAARVERASVLEIPIPAEGWKYECASLLEIPLLPRCCIGRPRVLGLRGKRKLRKELVMIQFATNRFAMNHFERAAGPLDYCYRAAATPGLKTLHAETDIQCPSPEMRTKGHHM